MAHPHKYRQIIQSYEARSLKRRSVIHRLADALTSTFGTITFLLANIFIFASWIIINTGLTSISVFDPYPFTMLTTLVSLEAIVLTIIVLMSQKRQGTTSILREELQLQVQMITEKEITKLLNLVKILLSKNGVKLDDKELEDMLMDVDESFIERKLEEQILPKSKNSPVEIVEKVEEKIIQK